MKPFLSLIAVALIVCAAGIASGMDGDTIKEISIGEFQTNPLVVYYSRTGATQTVALELTSTLLCDREELFSKKSRCNMGILNCVFDQLFNRDDTLKPLEHHIADYNPIIIAAPIWMHKIASPMRTFIKHTDLQHKDVYVVVTHQGNYSEKDEQAIQQSLSVYGITSIKGVYNIFTRKKPPEDIRQETAALAKQITR